MIGDTAKGTEPHVVQVFVENSGGKPNWDFERELYRVRKVTTLRLPPSISIKPQRHSPLQFLVLLPSSNVVQLSGLTVRVGLIA